MSFDRWVVCVTVVGAIGCESSETVAPQLSFEVLEDATGSSDLGSKSDLGGETSGNETSGACDDNPCQNGGTCAPGATGALCDCPDGWEGPTCATASDPCAANPCLNGGACAATEGGYSCTCAAGFEGDDCEQDTDDCAASPCKNEGVCTDKVAGFECDCGVAFGGETCELDIDACTGSPCLNGGACTDGVGTYTCACAAGFSGTICETNDDDCASSACLNGGTCADGIDAFTCSCVTGFNGETCQNNVDDCSAAPCLNGGNCVDAVNAYICVCVNGFTGDTCAVDTDHCAGSPCLNGSACTDGVAGYTCECATGYGGVDCGENVDDCAGNPCQNGGACSDLLGGFSCDCADGFDGEVCEHDIDDCDPDPCKNQGICADGAAGFSCDCADGYMGVVCAESIDECNGNPCQHGGTCVDGHLGYECKCQPGYEGTLCQSEANECAAAPCQHGGSCKDALNSYSCTCLPGYQGTNCEKEADECIPLPCQNGAACKDKLNGYDCECAAGYTGPTCAANIDDCIGSPCLNGGVCSDLVDGFKCQCATGWEGATCTLNPDDCEGNPCKNGGQCKDGLSTYSCFCAVGYEGVTCATNTDDCSATACQNGGICKDGIAAFTCTCKPGWTGNTCAQYDCPALDCNDDDVCTSDSCSSAAGCANVAESCDDGNACTTDACSVATVCPGGDNGTCYRGVASKKLSWLAAQAECAAFGGHLATISSAAENALVLAAATPVCAGDGAWIGLTDKAGEGSYSWITGEPVSYQPWGGGQPDDYQEGEDASEIWSDGNWNDVGMDTHRSCYVCEFEPVSAGCYHTPANACLDEDVCTDDVCDTLSGACSHPSTHCDDGSVCTTDACDEERGCISKSFGSCAEPIALASFTGEAASFTLVGDASVQGTILRVTSSAASKSGAAWWNERVEAGSGFDVSFRFNVSAPNAGGDYLAFVVQNQGTGATGFATNSVALVIDNVQDAGEPSGKTARLVANGSTVATRDMASGAWGGSNWANNGSHEIRLVYVPLSAVLARYTLSVDGSVTDTLELGTLAAAGAVDSDGKAWIGFIAKTGATAFESHNIEKFGFAGTCSSSTVCGDGDLCTDDTCDEQDGCTYTSNTDCEDGDPCTTDTCDRFFGCAPTPVTGGAVGVCEGTISVASPGTAGLNFLGSAATVGSQIRLTPATTNKNGTVWYPKKLYTGNGFSLAFKAYFSSPTGLGADGMCVFFGDVPATTAAHHFNLPARTISACLDSYLNGTEPSASFVELNVAGSQATKVALDFDLSTESATYKDYVLTYSFSTLTLSLTYPKKSGGTGVLSMKVDLTAQNVAAVDGQRKARFGFGATTGGDTEEHWLESFTFTESGCVAPIACAPTDDCRGGFSSSVCALAETSQKSCATLGLDPSAGDSAVCGQAPSTCPVKSSQSAAKTMCEGLGMRLCTVDELEHVEPAQGTCGFENQRAWTSTPCAGGGYYTAAGGGAEYAESVPTVCTEQFSLPGAVALCCADVRPMATVPRCQAPGTNEVAECDDDDECTVDICDPDSGCSSDADVLCPAPAADFCCEEHEAPGCKFKECQTCVCAGEPECCTGEWTAECVGRAELECWKDCLCDE